MLSTPGVWLTVPLTIVASGQPRLVGFAELLGGDGRTYPVSTSGRSSFSAGTAQPGIPRYATVVVEVPPEALPGAHLRIGLEQKDQRRDDVADIDLGLTQADADAWAADDDTRARRRVVRRAAGAAVSTPTVTQVPDAPAAGWWRRNRWALAALPVVLVLTLVAAGDRVRTLWWDQDLRVPTTVEAGTTGDFHQQGYDGSRRSTCRCASTASATPTTLPEDLELPAGTRAVQVDLTLSADPEVGLDRMPPGRARRRGHAVRLRVERLGCDAARRAVRPGGRARAGTVAG